MKRAFVLSLSAVAVLSALALATPPRQAQASHDGGAPADVARIRTHLEHVERELLTRDLSALTPAQRQARENAIAALREYRLAGVFPHNHHLAARAPFFVDDHGTLCAMGYLIARSGRMDLVRKVATTRNNALVRELASDPEIVAWLEENGMTAYEAGRVQPAYEPPPDEVIPTSDEFPASYAAASAMLGAASLGTVWLNTRPDPSPRAAAWRGALGMLAGGFSMVVGASGLGDSDYAAIGVANLAVGGVTAALGARNLLRAQGPPAAQAALRLGDGDLTLAATPVAGPRGAGVHFNVRF